MEVEMAKFMKVAKTEEVTPGQGKLIEVENRRIALFNVGGTYYAIDDTCTHAGGPLSEGPVERDVVTCPWHGSKFKISTGEVLSPPARRGVASYPVRVEGSDIKIEL